MKLKEKLHEIFFPSTPSTSQQLYASRHNLIVENSFASILIALAGGNFLAGYLSYLGASVSFCALVGAMPQFGCVMQLVAPFLFERLHYRKFAIWVLCFGFRISIGFSAFAPLLFTGKRSQLMFILIIYFFAYLAAGLVTPGLQQFQLDLAPQQGRGKFLAKKDVIAASANAVVALIMGWQLDAFTNAGDPYKGYLIIGVFSIVLSCIDAILLCRIREQPVCKAEKLRISALLVPIRDIKYRPIIMYTMWMGLFGSFATAFLYVHMLRNLYLTHRFITSAGILSNLAGMLGTWVWGRFADRSSWDVLLRRTALISTLCTLSWAFVNKETAPILAPVILSATAACAGGSGMASINLQYQCSPPTGKTTYLGVTSAVSSLLAWVSSLIAAAVQSVVEPHFGAKSIPMLFLLSGVLAFTGVITFGRKLPVCESNRN
ncbi:MFS transporter [Hydrogenoanaerobacterium saccharovorans]|uniref:Major Facilitator Superfamily protein n=1 Tax=Hydrogenoanaerobacterium saccharovorans TaxID=474960 RepID=A0A1H7ZSN7_9FIRM|nr:MFS transporter [Hydrogenoanaerobacterium saccharovorans]RPF48416.1 MFS transporter [Hydrogenoanaerobacterium saccharovorans]SEM61313.1 Major Facilitator Superfamily protein [Hydrogenoanaerobacterium saccharovorans]